MATALYKGKCIGGTMKILKQTITYLLLGSMLVFTLLPVVYMFSHSLKGEALILKLYQENVGVWQRAFPKPFYVNLDQYYRLLFRTPQYLYYFWNTLRVVGPIVVFQLALAILAAFGFSKLKFRGSETLFFIYIVMMLMPFQVTLVPNYMVLSQLKLLDTYKALILPGAFGTFAVFFLKQFMEGIDQSFIEEARLLGASDWQILKYIIVPMCKPIVISAMVLVFIDNWGMVEQPLIFISSREKMPLSVYLSSLAASNIHIGFACSVLYMILPLLLVLYAQDDLSDGLKISSLK